MGQVKEIHMKYLITTNLNNDKVYEVESMHEVSLDIVWASQRNLFSKGTLVTIMDENGNSKRFQK